MSGTTGRAEQVECGGRSDTTPDADAVSAENMCSAGPPMWQLPVPAAGERARSRVSRGVRSA
jgi:hypothetical protein